MKHSSNHINADNSEQHSSVVQGPTVKRKILKGGILTILSVLAIGVITIVGLGLMSSVKMSVFDSISTALWSFNSWFAFIRIAVIMIAIIYWEELNTWLAIRFHWSGERLERTIQGKYFTLFVLGFMELILIQRLHEPVIDFLLRK